MENKFMEEAYLPNVQPAELPADSNEPMTLAEEINNRAEEIDTEDATTAEAKKKNIFREKYSNASKNCKKVAQRVKKDLNSCGNNPYIASSTTYRYEIYRKPGDTKPVDVLEFDRSTGFSLRSFAAASLILSTVCTAIGTFFKK